MLDVVQLPSFMAMNIHERLTEARKVIAEEWLAIDQDIQALRTTVNERLELLQRAVERLVSTIETSLAEIATADSLPTGSDHQVINEQTSSDPNVSHPLRCDDIVEMVGTIHGMPCTRYMFQAIVWRYDLKSKPRYCWVSAETTLIKYSYDTVSFIQGLSQAEIELALSSYKRYRASLKHRTSGDAVGDAE